MKTLPVLPIPPIGYLRTALKTYYSDPAVRARIVEFLGGQTVAAATCHYLANYTHTEAPWFRPQSVRRLWEIAERELEIERSLWDRSSLLAHLDIEYVNFDRPWEPYVDPTYMAEVQQPVVRAIYETLGECGIHPLHLLSGRGHHFVWRLPFDSDAFHEMVTIGRLSKPTLQLYQQPHGPCDEVVSPTLGQAYAGLSLVMEYVSHQALRRAASRCPIPVQLTAVEVGPGARGREIVSIDLSEYGDPIHRRTARVPFGAYLKAYHFNSSLPASLAPSLPPLVMIPASGPEDVDGFHLMRNLDAVRRLARETSVEIPDQAAGTRKLIASYKRSAVAQFHNEFYAEEPVADEFWQSTYDRTPMESIPPCVRKVLEHPNDWLLKPAAIQQTVRVLLALGWHPRHISGLIRSKYERDHGWVIDQHFHDAASRAEFYTRLFAGLVATGLDGLIDFNCRSTQEKQYCVQSGCSWNLTTFKHSLQARTEHERLACRPFHRLLLPHEHS